MTKDELHALTSNVNYNKATELAANRETKIWNNLITPLDVVSYLKEEIEEAYNEAKKASDYSIQNQSFTNALVNNTHFINLSNILLCDYSYSTIHSSNIYDMFDIQFDPFEKFKEKLTLDEAYNYILFILTRFTYANAKECLHVYSNIKGIHYDTVAEKLFDTYPLLTKICDADSMKIAISQGHFMLDKNYIDIPDFFVYVKTQAPILYVMNNCIEKKLEFSSELPKIYKLITSDEYEKAFHAFVQTVSPKSITPEERETIELLVTKNKSNNETNPDALISILLDKCGVDKSKFDEKEWKDLIYRLVHNRTNEKVFQEIIEEARNK